MCEQLMHWRAGDSRGDRSETDEPVLWRRIGRREIQASDSGRTGEDAELTRRNYIRISSLSAVSGGVRSIFTD